MEKVTKQQFFKEKDKMFIRIRATEMKPNNIFMQYETTDKNIMNLQRRIKEALHEGVEDFWAPICDPSYDGQKIAYDYGKIPETDRSAEWWQKAAVEFYPERVSIQGDRNQYKIYLGYLVKTMISEYGFSLGTAWKTVASYQGLVDNPRKVLGLTGTGIGICGVSDLTNTYKIVRCNEGGESFAIVGAKFDKPAPLSDEELFDNKKMICKDATGWVILTEPPLTW